MYYIPLIVSLLGYLYYTLSYYIGCTLFKLIDKCLIG